MNGRYPPEVEYIIPHAKDTPRLPPIKIGKYSLKKISNVFINVGRPDAN
jgi:hypothetical protein